MNTKMKVLSLALVGLCGFAGSAMAACPGGPTTGEGGAWSSKSTTGGAIAISTPGLDGTECRMDAAIAANLGSASAFVGNDSPAAEPHYRAQFVINADALTAQNSTQPVRVFAANTSAPANGVPDVIKLTIFGNAAGTARVLGISTACTTTATFRCATTAPLTVSGNNTVELEWVKGGAGTGALRVWVNNNNPATPTASLDTTIDNSAWGGIDDAYLGLTAASANYRAAQLNKVVQFDRFDSRRQTFIGF